MNPSSDLGGASGEVDVCLCELNWVTGLEGRDTDIALLGGAADDVVRPEGTFGNSEIEGDDAHRVSGQELDPGSVAHAIGVAAVLVWWRRR